MLNTFYLQVHLWQVKWSCNKVSLKFLCKPRPEFFLSLGPERWDLRSYNNTSFWPSAAIKCMKHIKVQLVRCSYLGNMQNVNIAYSIFDCIHYAYWCTGFSTFIIYPFSSNMLCNLPSMFFSFLGCYILFVCLFFCNIWTV